MKTAYHFSGEDDKGNPTKVLVTVEVTEQSEPQTNSTDDLSRAFLLGHALWRWLPSSVLKEIKG